MGGTRAEAADTKDGDEGDAAVSWGGARGMLQGLGAEQGRKLQSLKATPKGVLQALPVQFQYLF